MKFFRNILAMAFILGMVASCVKEEITPLGKTDTATNKKSDDATLDDSIGDTNDDNDDNENDNNSDGEITDPENDLDFD